MTEITVSEEPAEDLEEGAAHAAAVHEGATRVHEEHAEEAAEVAAAAAAEATATGMAVMASTADAEAYADRAAESAAAAMDAAAACREAVEALTNALQSRTEEVRPQQEAQQTPVPDEPVKRKKETPPAPRKRTLGDRYFGR